MSLRDILDHYSNARSDQPPRDAPRDYEEIAREEPPEALSDGLAHAFRAEETPSFGEMVSNLFRNSDPHQRTGLLERLREALGGREPLDDADPRQVEELANKAEKHSPNIVERVSQFYAQHPTLVRNLGSAALTIALSRMAQRRRLQ